MGKLRIMTAEVDTSRVNEELSNASPKEIIRWALDFAPGNAICSTNFRPYESVILHMVTELCPDIPIVWVDSGVMLPETYNFADKLTKLLNLNLKVFNPEMTEARRHALFGPIPSVDDIDAFNRFSRSVKLDPFQRALKSLKPKVWITAIRRDQTQFRQSLNIISHADDSDLLKVAPLFDWNESDLEAYLEKHSLPNEKIYYDPVKANEKRECGLHTNNA